MLLWFCLATRVIVNPLSNVFQKLLTRRDVSPLAIVALTHLILAVVCLPLLFISPPPASFNFWGNMAVSVLLAAAANVLIVQAVQMSDLSILGPVNAYKAIVSIIPGIVLLGEVPSAASLLGITLILAGSYIIVDRSEMTPGQSVLARFFRDRAVQIRIAALVLSAVEAVYLKRALAEATPLATFAVWSVLGAVLLLPPTAGRGGGPKELGSLAANRQAYTLLAATTGLMQLSTLVVFVSFQVAPALALFQTSTLLSVLLGWRVFRERDIPRRLAGSAVMGGGAAIIVFWGT